MMYCPKCGAKNLDTAKFCVRCGAKLKPTEQDYTRKESFISKIPGFRSRTPWKMILASAGYLLIAILAIYAIGCLIINADATVTVNSAYAVDNIAGNDSTNGKFIVMNVTVKNNGKGPLTVHANEFSLLTEGEYITYSNFYGQGTDVPESVEIPEGESKSFLLVFDAAEAPEILEYRSSWDPFSEGKSVGIGTINIIPNTGVYAKYSVNGTANDKSYSAKWNVTYRNAPGGNIEEVIERSGETIWLTSTVYQTPIPSESYIFNPETLQDKNGTYSSLIFFSKGALIDVNDSLPIYEGEKVVGREILTGSETIDFMGKKIACWVTKTEQEGDGSTIEATRYYDKTTGLLLKEVFTEKGSAYGISYTDSHTSLLESTNIPLIGLS
ncbi:zinc-ribbon domain-containing protein [Methanothermobacter tenebrarum]|nr:zinc-ribbon domain-containing protein [Methanothermobacter tenebrarum]